MILESHISDSIKISAAVFALLVPISVDFSVKVASGFPNM